MAASTDVRVSLSPGSPRTTWVFGVAGGGQAGGEVAIEYGIKDFMRQISG